MHRMFLSFSSPSRGETGLPMTVNQCLLRLFVHFGFVAIFVLLAFAWSPPAAANTCFSHYKSKRYARAARCFQRTAKRRGNKLYRATDLLRAVQSYLKVTSFGYRYRDLRSRRKRKGFIAKRSWTRQAYYLLRRIQRKKMCAGPVGRRCRTKTAAYLHVVKKRKRLYDRLWSQYRRRNKSQRPQHPSISITSNPVGARLLINNDYKGTTPLKLTLPRGTYSLRLMMPGYQPKIEALVVEQSNQPLHFEMIRAVSPANRAVSLGIQTQPSGAIVMINGVRKGTTPLNVTLPPGPKRLSLLKPCYITKQRIITLKAQTPLSLNFTLFEKGNDPQTRQKRKAAELQKTIALGTIIVGGALFAVGGGFAIASLSTHSTAAGKYDEYKTCTTCSQLQLNDLYGEFLDLNSTGNLYGHVSIIGLVAGGVIAGTGAFIFLITKTPPRPKCTTTPPAQALPSVGRRE